MREKRVTELVRDLVLRGYNSEYLTRLRSRLDIEQAQEDLEREIVYEIACALGRAEEKVNVALLRLELARRELDEAQPGREHAERAEKFHYLRELAWQARYELLVHREAVGMRRNEILEHLYPIPPRVRQR